MSKLKETIYVLIKLIMQMEMVNSEAGLALIAHWDLWDLYAHCNYHFLAINDNKQIVYYSS